MTMIDPHAADGAAEPAEPAIDEVRELLAEGRERGYLTAEHIADALRDVKLNPEQIDDIVLLFNDLGIDIIEGNEPAAVDDAEDGAEQQAPKLDLSLKNPTSDPVRRYLSEIGRVALLTADQEVSLARRIERRDMAAKCQLIEANLRLVVSIARRYVGTKPAPSRGDARSGCRRDDRGRTREGRGRRRAAACSASPARPAVRSSRGRSRGKLTSASPRNTASKCVM